MNNAKQSEAKENNLTKQSEKSVSKLKQENKLKKETLRWKHHKIEM